MSISVIVPAYNEERYIGETLNNLNWAKDCLLKSKGISTEIIVVDNGSTDSTVSIALSSGAKVIKEFIQDIQVIPSTRRFDRWPLWRTLVFTNPLFILIFRRRKGPWKEWYGTMGR